MSKKKQTLRKITAEYYSEDWPYSDVFVGFSSDSELDETIDDAISLPAIRGKDFPLSNSSITEIIIEEQIESSRKNHFISFAAGAVFSSILAFAFFYTPAPDNTHKDALVLLRELNEQFQAPVSDTKLSSEQVDNQFSLLDGPQLIEKLLITGSEKDKLIWLEASKRQDERVSRTLVKLLDSNSERRRIHVLLALSSSFHSKQSLVFRRVVSGIQNDFSPFVRAYATKMIAHTYGSRAKKFLQSRIRVEDNSFVLALTTKMIESFKEDSRIPNSK